MRLIIIGKLMKLGKKKQTLNVHNRITNDYRRKIGRYLIGNELFIMITSGYHLDKTHNLRNKQEFWCIYYAFTSEHKNYMLVEKYIDDNNRILVLQMMIILSSLS